MSILSSSISNIVNAFSTAGIQTKQRYDGLITHVNSGKVFQLAPYAIDVSFPAAKFMFYNNAYWKGNQEFKQPVGIRYEDNLIITFIVSATTNKNIMTYLQDTVYNQSSLFRWRTVPTAAGLDGDDFILENPVSCEFSITIHGLDNKDQKTTSYYYYPCFLEKILPTSFSTIEPGYQTTTLSFAVSGSNL